MNIWLELFGYIGTFFVLLSMMMTSMGKLRFFNILGSAICAVYALCTHTLPVFFLNLGLIIINVTQLIRIRRMAVQENEEVNYGTDH